MKLIYNKTYSTYRTKELMEITNPSPIFDKLINDIDKQIKDLNDKREEIVREDGLLSEVRRSILDYNAVIKFCNRVKENDPDNYNNSDFWMRECLVKSADEAIKSEKQKVDLAIRDYKSSGLKNLVDWFTKLIKIYNELQKM